MTKEEAAKIRRNIWIDVAGGIIACGLAFIYASDESSRDYTWCPLLAAVMFLFFGLVRLSTLDEQ